MSKLVTCRKCGESGTIAGGLHKVDGEYECNNSVTCGNLMREKEEILSQRKVKEQDADNN